MHRNHMIGCLAVAAIVALVLYALRRTRDCVRLRDHLPVDDGRDDVPHGERDAPARPRAQALTMSASVPRRTPRGARRRPAPRRERDRRWTRADADPAARRTLVRSTLRQVTRYENATGAQLAVLAPGTRSLFAEGSRVSESDITQVRQIQGVRWASACAHPVRHPRSSHAQGRRQPHRRERQHARGPVGILVRSRAVGGGRSAVDRVLAARHSIQIGDTLTVLGQPLHVVGLTSGTSSFMTGYVFVTYDDRRQASWHERRNGDPHRH